MLIEPCCGSQPVETIKSPKSKPLPLHRECLLRTNQLQELESTELIIFLFRSLKPESAPCYFSSKMQWQDFKVFFELQNCPPMVLLVCSKSNENWFQLEVRSFFRDGVFIIWFESKTPDLYLGRTVGQHSQKPGQRCHKRLQWRDGQRKLQELWEWCVPN